MRTPNTASLAAAIALAFASPLYAATAISTGANSANGTFIRSSTAVPTPASTSATTTSNTTTNTTTTGTATAPANTTNVDVRNLQTQQAVAGTHASGSTSALGPLANGNASVNSPTTVGSGTTSGVGASGTGSSTGSTTGTTNNATTTTVLGGGGGVPFVVTPMYSNPSDVTAGVAPAGNSIMANGLASNDVYAGAVTSPDVAVAANSAANGVSVDRAINQVSRDRKRVGRNGQLLYSIAPRTNGVDRTNQMPDDGPSPALTGSNSTLAR